MWKAVRYDPEEELEDTPEEAMEDLGLKAFPVECHKVWYLEESEMECHTEVYQEVKVCREQELCQHQDPG